MSRGLRESAHGEDSLEDPLNELGRRLAAAYLSFSIGNRNIDNVLKNHIGDRAVGEYWQVLARVVFEDMSESRNRRLGRPIRRSEE